MFLGWHDPDKRTPVVAKIAAAVGRYREKFGAEPVIVHCHPDDAEAAQGCGLDVRPLPYVPRRTCYVGIEDEGVDR